MARALVEHKLAACAQIGEIESFYSWQGTVANEREFRILFKTTEARYPALEAAIRELHDYECRPSMPWPWSGWSRATARRIERAALSMNEPDRRRPGDPPRRPEGGPTRQRLPYFVGISAQTVGASGLSMHLVVIPPGGRSEPHSHLDYETGIYVSKERC